MTPKEALKLLNNLKMHGCTIAVSNTGGEINEYTYLISGYKVDLLKKQLTELEAKSKRLEKVGELLGLYRLEKETKEKYHTSGSLYVMQHVLDELREIAEEIYRKEKELEEMKEPTKGHYSHKTGHLKHFNQKR